jgi:DNA-binding XRE family transcriptional regulator
MQWIDWPPSDAGSEEGAVEGVFRSAEEFAQASAVLRGFEELSWDGEGQPVGGFTSFAEALSWLRDFFGLSPGELAEIAGLSAKTIRALEGGRRRPQRDTCYLIARRLQTPFNQNLICAGHRGICALWEPPRD